MSYVRMEKLSLWSTNTSLPKCPDSFTYTAWKVSLEGNISLGAYFGAYAYINTSVSQGEEFSWETIKRNDDAGAGFTTGISGAAVEIGVRGSIGLHYPL